MSASAYAQKKAAKLCKAPRKKRRFGDARDEYIIHKAANSGVSKMPNPCTSKHSLSTMPRREHPRRKA